MIKLTDENFNEEVLKAKQPVLVDFWAGWCMPCKMAEPIIKDLAKEYQGKMMAGKLNVDENPKITHKYRIMSIPTVIILHGGQEIKRLIGFLRKEEYKKMIEEVLE
jgi:thioredoxin 1